MKRVLALTMSVLIIISAMFSTNAFAFGADTSMECGDKGSNVLAYYDKANCTLTLKGSGAMKDYISSPWARVSDYDITDVIIGDGITHIGNSAFAGMLRLKNVSISNTVKSVGKNAFSGSILLESVNLPASVETIGAGAFITKGVAFKGVFVDKNNKSFTDINGMLFDKKKETLYLVPATGSAVKLEIPNTVKTIVDKAAINCVNLKEVVIPESVTALGNEVFTGEKSDVQKITILNRNLSLPEQLTLVSDTEKLTIAGYTDSTAQKYADAWDIRFEPLDKKCDHNFIGKVTKKATCKTTGVKTFTCSICGETKTTSIAKTSHTYKNVVTKATLSKNGKIENKCSVCGKVSKTTAINYVKTIKLSKTGFVYNGKVQKPSVVVKDSAGKTLKLNTDYTVTYSNSSSKNVNKYTVTIKLKGNYSGTKTIGYKINPKPTEFVPSNKGGFKAISKGFTLKWNKQSSQTTGYQIQYATKRDFSNAATITIANPNTTSKTIKGRAGNKRYYVRVRTYKKTSSSTFYSGWNSGVKSVVTLR